MNKRKFNLKKNLKNEKQLKIEKMELNFNQAVSRIKTFC